MNGGARQNPHQKQPAYYKMNKHSGAEKARTGVNSIARNNAAKGLDISEEHQDGDFAFNRQF